MRNYLRLASATLGAALDTLEDIIQKRRDDVKDFDNLNNIFISGRKTARIPSGATDVLPTDKVGDINYDLSYAYVLTQDGATVEWRRFALASW